MTTLRNLARASTARRGFWIYTVALVCVAIPHYCRPQVEILASYPLTRHAVVRILFILPVAGATSAFGLVGGLVTLAIAVLIMLPRVFLISAYPLDAFIEVMATALIGGLVVWMLAAKEKDRRSYQKAVSRLTTINTVTSELAQSLDLEHTLDDVLDHVLEVLGLEAGAVYLLDEEEQGLTLVAHRNLPAAISEVESGLKSARMLARYEGFQCKLTGPLRSKGRINGLLFAADSKSCPLFHRDVELVTTVCNQLSVVVENTRLYRDIARQLEIERSLYEVVEEITSEIELDKILPKVVQIAETLVGADGGIVALWDEERNVVTYPYLHNLPKRLANVTVSKEEGLSAEVMLTGCPMVIDNYPGYARAIPAFIEAGVTSVAGVPIQSGDRAFGAMCVVSIRKAKSFPDRDVAILSGIGRQAGIAVENAYLYQNLRFYARRITQAQENERKRIARELHDDTIQSLIALSRSLEALVTSDERLPVAVVQRVRKLWRQTDDTIQRVRRFSKNLRPSILDDLGLLPTLDELTADLNRQAGLEADFRVLGAKQRLSSEMELTLFRVAQEALSNVMRHAHAKRVTTTIEIADSTVRMTVQDDGIGFRPPKLTEDLTAESELGLIGMHERVRLLGGALTIESAPGDGTQVIVQMPI